MSKEHRVLIGPGMDGRTKLIRWATRNWPEKYGLTPETIEITWKDDIPLEPKLKKVLDAIDVYTNDGDTVDLVGCSASGSLMYVAFSERKDAVRKVANLSGFIRPGTEEGFRSFETRSAASIAFQEAVLMAQDIEPSLSELDRSRILTVRPWFDELVPANTVVIEGASNKTVPAIEHVWGISHALVFYRPLIEFLKQN